MCGLLAPIVARGAGAFASYDDVKATLATLGEILPPELKGDEPSARQAWPTWIARHDREIRTRLERGDEDTIVNWLLFGTSFTKRPRALLDRAGDTGANLAEVIAGRAVDLASALASPGRDERRLFARRLLERQGYQLETPEERKRLEAHFIAEVARVVGEQQRFAGELAAARQAGDATEEFAARSKLFRDRGLSLDTSMLPGFALERALAAMLAQGLLPPMSVRRVAVIGPGLDFADKGSGYDFYPQQTVQPLALIDSLVRLGLSRTPAAVDLTTLDISERVNDHLRAVTTRAKAGSSVVVRFPLDPALPWTPEVVEYWRHVGDRIGVATEAAAPAAIGTPLAVRAVRVRPDVLSRLVPRDFNIVTERWTGAPFDLVVATNVLVYYDTLDQSLAAAAIEALLRPGGFFLSNNALLELPSSRMRSVGYLTVPYSARPDDGDHIVWYRRDK